MGHVLRLIAAGLGLIAAGAAVATPPPRQIGQLTLEFCPEVGSYCGHFKRDFDPTGQVPGKISIYFEYTPHADADLPSEGTLVAAEGGPGYPTTGTGAAYKALFGPLMKRRDLVMMDNRGTGRSQLIECPLQTAKRLTVKNIAECGRQLGETAPLYSGAYAADDLAALLAALGAAPIDLYGDSYGTYFSQTFAYRHPQWLRSIVLDSAYPVPQVGGETPWYPTYAPAVNDTFNLVCARSPGCRDLPGSSISRIQPALDALRAAPFDASARDADGKTWHFPANASTLAMVMFASSPAHASTRETDAAARAFVAGDRAPLLRLMAETLASSDSSGTNPVFFSSGAYVAVNCQDVAQIYDMTLPPPLRKRQRDAVVAEQERNAPDTYAPFTISEFRGMALDYSLLDACVGWPAPPPQHPPGPHVPPDAQMPAVPVLVLSGELDMITTPAEGRIVAGLFPQGRFVLAANSFHIAVGPALFDGCAAKIARHFIATLDPGDTGCAAEIAPLRTPPSFARRIDDLPAAEALPGNEAGERERRAAFAAVQTLGDALARLETNTSGRAPGLRGGHFTIDQRAGRYHLKLERVRWTEDLAVSGLLAWPAGLGPAEAAIRLVGPDGIHGEIAVRWTERVPESIAEIEGKIGDHRISARMPAP